MLPEKFKEALEAVLYVALNSGGRPVSGKAICEYQGVAPRHLEPILQALVKEGILHGSKGPKGGYSLAKERRRITMADIVKTCIKQNSSQGQSPLYTSIIAPYIKNTEGYTLKLMSNTTLEKLCNNVDNPPSTQKKPDFHI